jgi:CubicO group peptidase (beta-lactamase class C family)
MRRAGGRIHLVDRDRPERRRWIRLAVVGLACVLGAACTGTDSQEATRAPEAPARPDYWPTAGWKTAAPAEQGMDPAVLDDLDTKVPEFYPQVRSVLVVRHGYLVYERYWQGVTAGDGHDVRSVTKSVVSALVGIALRDRHLRSLDQTVEELLAEHLPARGPAAPPGHPRAAVDHDLRLGWRRLLAGR